jgi:hypothetical protein
VDVRHLPLAELRAMPHRGASGTGLSATRRQRFPFRTGAVPAGIPLTRTRLALTAAGHWDVSVHGGATYRPDGVTVTVSARFDALRQLGPGGVLGPYRTIEVLPDPAHVDGPRCEPSLATRS